MIKIKISIIIAVFNGISTLRTCIDSVLRQQDADYELIVIDGGSNDGTVELLRSYPLDRFNWISETDTGIFDAWNKGLERVNGQWIMFLGADDYLATENIISDLADFISSCNEAYDFVTVRNISVRKNGDKKSWGHPWKWPEFRRHMSTCHVGALHNANYFKKYGVFDTQYKIAGDYEILLRAGKHLKTIDYPIDVAYCGEEGISRKQIRKAFCEAIQIQSRHQCSNPIVAFSLYGYAYLKYQMSSLIGLSNER